MTLDPPATALSPRRPPFPVNGPGAALLCALAGMACLSTMDSLAKALGASLPTTQIVLFRFAGTALIMALFIAATRRAWPQRRHLPRHALRGAVMAATAFLFFYGVTHLPLVVGTALAMVAPIYIALMGVVILKEPWSARIATGLLVGVLGGVVIIAGSSEAGSANGAASGWAWAAAILAPISYSAGVILLKSHAAHEGAAAMTMAQSLASALIALPFALPGLVVPAAADYWQIGLLGVFGALGYLLIVSALRVLPASVFSLVDYTSLVWAAALGMVFFGEIPGLAIWAGGFLIILACWLGARRRAVIRTPQTESS